jgi:hypothetical protein
MMLQSAFKVANLSVVRLVVTVPTSESGKIHAALNVKDGGRATSSTSFVSLRQKISSQFPFNMNVFVPALPPSISPSIQINLPSKQMGGWIPHTTLGTRFNPSNPYKEGLSEALFTLPNLLDGGNMMLGAWMTYHSMRQIPSVYSQWMNEIADDNIFGPHTRPTTPSTHNYSPSTIHVQGVAEYGESMVAAHAEMPLSPYANFKPHQTNALLWLNLSSGSSGNDHSGNSTMPPIWLTLQQSHIRGDQHPTYTLNLSQILSLHRPCWNILEERAPLIRNHLGWVIQVERNANITKNDNTTSSNPNQVSFGASWQINRNVACKAVLDNNGTTLKTNIIFKRWKQPRMTLSILNGIDLSGAGSGGSSPFNKPTATFIGFGLEVETTSMGAWSEDAVGNRSNPGDRPSYQEHTNVDGTKAPPTKIKVNAPAAT